MSRKRSKLYQTVGPQELSADFSIPRSVGGMIISCAFTDFMNRANLNVHLCSPQEIRLRLLSVFARLAAEITMTKLDAEVESWFVSASDAVYLDFMRWMDAIWCQNQHHLEEIMHRLQADKQTIAIGLQLQKMG